MKELLVMFAVYGLVAIPCICMFAGGVGKKQEKLIGVAVVCVLWVLLSVACWGNHNANTEKWNGGYCECGTHWELVGASHYRTSKTKYYVCPNCYAEIEID